MKMKVCVFIILFFSLLSVSLANVVDTTYWTKGGTFGLNFTQVSLSNWAAGGQDAVSGVAQFKVFANYKKANVTWDNKLDLGYGLSFIEEPPLQKIEDIIDLQSKLGIQSSNKWYYAVLGSFKTQFTPGYSDKLNTIKASNLFAPAYLTLSIGMDYKPSDKFTLFLSPLSGKMTIVTDPDLDGKFGVEAGKNSRMELGATLRTNLKREIMKNVNLDTDLGLFSNYLKDPQRIDVDWKLGLIMNVNKFLSVRLNTHLIYDYDIKFPVEESTTGETEARVQFKEIFGVGFNFKF